MSAVQFPDLGNEKSIFIGLGNPGKNFTSTRHNVGYIFIESIIQYYLEKGINYTTKLSATSEVITCSKLKLYLLRPQTFMNSSGEATREVINYLKIPLNRVIVAYDDLDLTIGKYKLQFSNHPKSHNGLNSIINELKSEEFFNLRIGINNPISRIDQQPGSDYVLSDFSSEEYTTIKSTIKEIITALFATYS